MKDNVRIVMYRDLRGIKIYDMMIVEGMVQSLFLHERAASDLRV